MKLPFIFIIPALFFACRANELKNTPKITSKYQIFYLGVQHEILLTGVKKIDSTLIKTNGGALKYIEKCRFSFIPNKIGPSDFYVKYKDQIIRQHYIVVKTPDPIPAIIYHEKNYSDTSRIKTYKEFEPYEEMASIFNLGHTLHFKIKLIRNDSLIFDHTNLGGQFDEVVRNLFRTIKSKDTITFTNWVINAPEGVRIIKEEYKIAID